MTMLEIVSFGSQTCIRQGPHLTYKSSFACRFSWWKWRHDIGGLFQIVFTAWIITTSFILYSAPQQKSIARFQIWRKRRPQSPTYFLSPATLCEQHLDLWKRPGGGNGRMFSRNRKDVQKWCQFVWHVGVGLYQLGEMGSKFIAALTTHCTPTSTSCKALRKLTRTFLQTNTCYSKSIHIHYIESNFQQ